MHKFVQVCTISSAPVVPLLANQRCNTVKTTSLCPTCHEICAICQSCELICVPISYGRMLPTKFVVQPSESLKCPICRGLFKDPVISTQCGHTFCRTCIRNGVSITGNSATKCPQDGTILQRLHLVSNLAVRGQVEDLLIHCRHGLTRSDSEEDFEIDATGCQERISFGRRSEHEEVCGFALVPCPNSSNQCGKFRRQCLEDHLTVCAQYRCPYSVKGM